MVHKSWGTPAATAPGMPTRSPAPTPAYAPDTRSRLDARAAARAEQAREREAAREARRKADAELAERDPHRAAAQRRRGSGRKDIVREQRDTSGYAMVVDRERVRALAQRGASPASLAAAFQLPVEEIVALLHADD